MTAYRTHDPLTSRMAAVRVDLTQGQALVLHAFRMHRDLTDDELLRFLGESISPSGARTRRSELVAKGKVRDTGRIRANRHGRMMTVWELVPPPIPENEQRALWGDR